MHVKFDTFLIYITGAALLLILGRLFTNKMKYIGKIISSILIGGIIIAVINFIGSYFDFNIPLNLISAFITGILGLPGIIMLVILKYTLLM
ncbi:MAG: pro-sigmaK processing inhibitor BofA family protein [Bacteroidota bacterium]|nr:pro-sigmaK processing inhibitor BofA family protein [Bacteroidota bacterium]